MHSVAHENDLLLNPLSDYTKQNTILAINHLKISLKLVTFGLKSSGYLAAK